MSDYMAQKMDDQITGAISENERLSGVLHVACQWLALKGRSRHPLMGATSDHR